MADCKCYQSQRLLGLKLTHTEVSISESRTACKKWTDAWSQTDPSVWLSVYADDATYTDYAFNFIRRGKKGLDEHFKIWRHAHPDFRADILEAWPGIELNEATLGEHLLSDKPTLVKYSVRTSNKGTFTNDLPTLKASGKEFNFCAVVDIVVRVEDGLIVRVDEWYHRQFDAKIIERDNA